MGKSLDVTDTLCIVSYCLALFGIALYQSRKLKRQDDIYLAGRSMSRWPIAISMYMAIFSTNTLLGSTGWLSRPHGTIWIGVQSFGAMLAVPLVVELYPALYFRLQITSAYEYLDRRFNHAVRNLATMFFLGARLMWMSTIIYSASLIVSMMLGWTPLNGFLHGQFWAILAIGSLATSFALIGGMRGVIWTDVLQFIVLLSGVITIITLGLGKSGGVTNVVRVGLDAGRFTFPSLFSLTDDLSLLGGMLLGFVGILSMSGSDQVLLQQYLTARSEREAKASIWRNGLFLKPVSLIYPFVGLIMFAYYRAHPEVARLMRIPDDALPVFVTNVFPAGVRGLMTIAMIAAVLTSVQSGLAAVSAALQVNYVNRWFARPLSDRGALLLARSLILLTGVTIVFGACGVQHLGQRNSVIQILNIVMYPFTGVLLGIFLLGILSHRANSQGVLIGSIIGIFVTAAFPLSQILAPVFHPEILRDIARVSSFYLAFIGAVITIGAGYAASLLFAPPPKVKIEGLTRRSLPAPGIRTTMPVA
jgi:SSS family transporter